MTALHHSFVENVEFIDLCYISSLLSLKRPAQEPQLQCLHPQPDYFSCAAEYGQGPTTKADTQHAVKGLDRLPQTTSGTSDISPPVPQATPEDVLAAALVGKTLTVTPGAILAGGPISIASIAGDASRDTAAANATDDGLDWLSAAAVGGQSASRPSAAGAAVRRRSLSAGKAAPAPAAGGWLTSGKLGVSTEDGSCDKDCTTLAALGSKVAGVDGKNNNAASLSKTKNSKDEKSMGKKKGSEPGISTGAPGGWLAAAISSGNLGVDREDGSEDEDVEGGRDGTTPKTTTVGTQWEEGGGEAVANKATETKLPPWAKKWIPPVPDPPPIVEDNPTSAETKAKPSASGLDWITGALTGSPAEENGQIRLVFFVVHNQRRYMCQEYLSCPGRGTTCVNQNGVRVSCVSPCATVAVETQ